MKKYVFIIIFTFIFLLFYCDNKSSDQNEGNKTADKNVSDKITDSNFIPPDNSEEVKIKENIKEADNSVNTINKETANQEKSNKTLANQHNNKDENTDNIKDKKKENVNVELVEKTNENQSSKDRIVKKPKAGKKSAPDDSEEKLYLDEKAKADKEQKGLDRDETTEEYVIGKIGDADKRISEIESTGESDTPQKKSKIKVNKKKKTWDEEGTANRYSESGRAIEVEQ